MPRYKYIARDKFAKKVSGFLFAENENDLGEKLSHSGYVLISCREEKAVAGKGGVKLKPAKVLNFTQSLSSLLKGGLNLLDALNMLAQDTEDKELYSVISGLKDYIQAGGSFKGALSLYPNIFSKFHIAMVDAGEKTGRLDLTLEQIADYLDWQLDLRGKIKELTVYPVIILIMMVAVITVLVGWVIPKFEPILREIGVELPLPTKIVLGLSHLFTKFWYITLGILFILGVAIKVALIKSAKARFYLDKLKLKIPVLGNLIYKLCIARFSRSMMLGLASGVGILGNLDLGEEIIGNEVLSRAVLTVRESVATGGELSTALDLTKAFPVLLVRMVGVGERSGNLTEGFKNIFDFYNREIPRVIKRIFVLLEPLLIVLLGLVVGGVAIAVFLPLIKMTQGIGG